MKKCKLLSQILIIVLIIVAAIVAAIIAAGRNAWGMIISYWIVLTIKNAVDLIASIEERKEKKKMSKIKEDFDTPDTNDPSQYPACLDDMYDYR